MENKKANIDKEGVLRFPDGCSDIKYIIINNS